jgi:hypothetical protein
LNLRPLPPESGRPLHAEPHPPGVHQVPQRRRARRPARQDHPCHRRQLRHPQASQEPAPAKAGGKQWLADHPRWVFHFTPTSASWLNAVEGFFSTITRRQIRRGIFKSVADLQEAIRRYIREHNRSSKPFVWTKPADTILAKLTRLPVSSE